MALAGAGAAKQGARGAAFGLGDRKPLRRPARHRRTHAGIARSIRFLAIFSLFAGRLWTRRITFDSLWMIRMCGVAGSSTGTFLGERHGRSGRVERARWLDFCPP